MLARLRRVRCKLGASIIVSSDQRNLVFSICPEVADPQSAIGRLENYPCRSPGPAQGRARCRAGPPRPGSGRGQGARRGRGQGREGKGRAKGTGRWPGSVQFRSSQVKSSQVRSGQVRSGQVKSGQVRSGQVRSGQVRSGQVKSGQVRSSQVRSGQSFQRFLTWNVFRGLFPRQGLALAVPPWYEPVPWDPWPGEWHTLRWIDLSRGRHAQSALALLGRALLGQAARSRAASGRTGPAVSRSGSESNGADGPGSVH